MNQSMSRDYRGNTSVWIAWFGLLAGLAVIAWSIYKYWVTSKSSVAHSFLALRLLVGLAGGGYISYMFWARIVRERNANNQSRTVPEDNSSRALPTSNGNLIRIAFFRRPLATTAFFLILIGLPALIALSGLATHGGSINSTDWRTLLVGEAIVAVVGIYVWYRRN
jgi:hypothetical protein